MDDAKLSYLRALREKQADLESTVRRAEEDLATVREIAVVTQRMIEHLERDERASPS